MLSSNIIKHIAYSVSIEPEKVEKVVELLNSGCTIPFILRYRADLTGNLDESKLEAIATENLACTALEQRRSSILINIEKAGRLTDALREEIEACMSKHALEDLYMPYKRKKRTKAMVARERGLGPLADLIWAQEPGGTPPEEAAKDFVDSQKMAASTELALEGARHILAERVSEDAGARKWVREKMLKEGKIASISTKLSEGKKTKFSAYYNFSEPIHKIPSHRFLAILRGVKEGSLRMDLALDDDAILSELMTRFLNGPESPAGLHLRSALEDAYRRIMRPAVELEVIAGVRKRADDSAIAVFRENARNLLMTPPAGARIVIGLDPAPRSGSQLAVVSGTGDLLEAAKISPFESDDKRNEAEETLLNLIDRHGVDAVAIASRPGSRELCRFVQRSIQKCTKKPPMCVLVNEAGASSFSSSKPAREEFPDVDATTRSAVSIARRLQDPLSEFVKLEPRSVGVGQYQHDVNQKLLREGLHETFVSCVCRIGVDLNTASVPLLRYVSGVQYGTAQNIVAYRKEKGRFTNRQQLLEIPGVGPAVFQQCAGFLRITGGDNPLDSTGIHPEAYAVVENIALTLGVSVGELMGNRELLEKLELKPFASPALGEIGLARIRDELIAPARDPRKRFRAPKGFEGVESLNNLDKGLEIEGMVTNVTDFGAFVDIGIDHDGLVHLSELANRFVRDPRQVVRVGQIVRVKIIELDKEAPRISLSMKALQPVSKRSARSKTDRLHGQERQKASRPDRPKRSASSKRPSDAKTRPPRKAAKQAKRTSPSQPKIHESGERSQLNTQLADQLAGLKEKLGS